MAAVRSTALTVCFAFSLMTIARAQVGVLIAEGDVTADHRYSETAIVANPSNANELAVMFNWLTRGSQGVDALYSASSNGGMGWSTPLVLGSSCSGDHGQDPMVAASPQTPSSGGAILLGALNTEGTSGGFGHLLFGRKAPLSTTVQFPSTFGLPCGTTGFFDRGFVALGPSCPGCDSPGARDRLLHAFQFCRP